MSKDIPFKEGDELTVAHDIITNSGSTILRKGDKVLIEKVLSTNGHYHRMFHYWVPAKLTGFNLADHYGHWLPVAFEETKDF